MADFGSHRFEVIGNTVRKKRSQISRRPRPESQNRSSLSTPTSEDASKVSSDDVNDVDANPRRKVLNLNESISKVISSARPYGGTDGFLGNSGNSHSGVTANGGSKVRKVKLKLGGVTRTIQAESSSHGTSGSRSSSKSAQSSDAFIQGSFDEGHSIKNKKGGLQGIPWKDFSRGGFSLGKENPVLAKLGERSDLVRKTKRVSKKHNLDGEFNEDDDDDDEIRYLEKLKTSKFSAGYRDFGEESSQKHRSLSRVSKGDYEDEDLVFDLEHEGTKKKHRKGSVDSPTETKRETTFTTRQQSLLSGRDASVASGSSQIEFPNGLPPAPPRKPKEQLSELEQQLKRAEAAKRRKLQNEKAARESEAEAIRKILGQDSSRKKREEKLKKRREELAQEKAANAQVLPPGIVRTVMGPNGTVVTFAEDIGLPHVFDPKPTGSFGYPPPRAKCAGPSCPNPYKYRDSKSNLPLCSLLCYKAVHGRINPKPVC